MAEKSSKTLTAEDRTLWKKVTDTVKPRAGRVVGGPSSSDEALFSSAIKALGAGARKTGGKGYIPAKNAVPAPIKKPALVQPPKPALLPLSHMERRAKSRLARGIEKIDARVDLHGMTQQEAHTALLAFIGRARLSGWKTVLVITGKGAPAKEGERVSLFELGREAPGVLRRKVPQWLSEPQMREFVVGFDKASPKHGGSGALYVRIRRQKS